MSLVYYIPEYQEDRKSSFFANEGVKLSNSVVSVDGYSLYAIKNSLNDFSRPFTCVAVPSASSKASFYRVQFSTKQNFSSFGLELSEENVVFMKEEELLKQGDVIPVESGDWSEASLKFHAIGAFYYLGLVPSLPAILFNDNEHLNALNQDFQKMFNIQKSYQTALPKLFAYTFIALQFFGFTETSDPVERKALEFAKELTKKPAFPHDSRYIAFAFGNIKQAISRYHEKCFSSKVNNPQLFTPLSFHMLRDTFNLVLDLFNSLNFPVSKFEDEDFKESLYSALKHFQNSRKINEERCGQQTLRALLYDTALRNEVKLSQAVSVKKISKIPKAVFNSQLIGTTSNLGELLYRMPNLADQEGCLSKYITTTICENNNTSEILRERIENCENRIKLLKNSLNQLAQINSRIERQLDQANTSLTNVLTEHVTLQERLVAIKDKISSEKLTNEFLRFCAAIIIISVFMWLFRFL